MHFVAIKVCCDKTFVMTKLCLLRHVFVMTKVLSWQQQQNCHEKHNFLRHKTFVVRNIILLRQKLLLWQAYFCRDKMCPFSSKLVVLSLQNLWFVDTVLWLGPSQLTKCYNAVISAHLNAESVWWWQRSSTHPPPSPGISVPTSVSSETTALTPSLPQPVKFPAWTGPITHLLLMLCVLMKILSHGSRKRKQKGLMVSNFVLLFVIFKWHHSSEGVKQVLWTA